VGKLYNCAEIIPLEFFRGVRSKKRGLKEWGRESVYHRGHGVHRDFSKVFLRDLCDLSGENFSKAHAISHFLKSEKWRLSPAHFSLFASC
jgi:hypothetical protein